MGQELKDWVKISALPDIPVPLGEMGFMARRATRGSFQL
jgi:hypothetical protein